MTTPSRIARTHFEAALAEAARIGHEPDQIARAMFALVVKTYLQARSPEDVRAELLTAAENVDPDTDYPFMRP
ncbi:MAG: hypothetical protein HXY25_10490 [Alphaproteobacteria bacterium]|nr:hypothetical protein [Alphaproteobacteria bacterium]